MIILVSEDDVLHRHISSIMTFNPATQKYETPPPRWFNKDTGEYEDVKPIYFLDLDNPSLGFVAPGRITREDDVFRQFIEEKGRKRRFRLEREQRGTETAHIQPLNAPRPEPSKLKAKATVTEFDDGSAQKSFRQIAIKVMSKQSANQFTGPSTLKDEGLKRELEERYTPLKPFAPSDVQIEPFPPQVDEEEIINTWRNSPTIRVEATSPRKRERVKALVANKCGGRDWTYAAMRGSYLPSNMIHSGSSKCGWEDEKSVLVRAEDSAEKLWGWKHGPLESTAWWEIKAPSSSNAIREDRGKLTFNPATGKLKDVASFTGSSQIARRRAYENCTTSHSAN